MQSRDPTRWFTRCFNSDQIGAIQTRPVRIAMIGDSLSMGFYVSSVVSMLFRLKIAARRNWVVDDRGIIDSVFERLSKKFPVTLHHFACVSAHVDPVAGSRLVDSLTGICH